MLQWNNGGDDIVSHQRRRASAHVAMVYPVLILTAWIQQCLIENVESRGCFTKNIIVKNIVAHEGPNTANYTPVVRLQNINSVLDKTELIVTIHDSKHKILGVFTREAIQKFESKYKQRISFETSHTLMTLRRANLKLISKEQYKHFSPFLPKTNIETSLAYLEIMEVDIFSRSRHEVPGDSEKKLIYIYVTQQYQRLLGQRSSDIYFEDTDGKIDEFDMIE